MRRKNLGSKDFIGWSIFTSIDWLHRTTWINFKDERIPLLPTNLKTTVPFNYVVSVGDIITWDFSKAISGIFL